jgi:hypothetical protein
MTLELPRFNQRFVNKLQDGSDEQRFVSGVGDVTFLTMAHLRTLHGIQADLREPLYHMDKNPDVRAVERALYFGSYPSMFETVLIDRGLQEYVVALNGLKDAITRLKGRNIAWTDETRADNAAASRFDEYIGDSIIGFYPDSVEVPALSLELAKEAGSRGHLVDIECMRNIEIYPQ